MKPNLKNAVISLVGMGVSYNSVDGVITNWDISDPPSGITQPTQSEIDAEIKRLQAEYDSNEYQRDRQYPPIGEQLDMIYHAGQGGDKFQTTIKAIKDAHPKPE